MMSGLSSWVSSRDRRKSVVSITAICFAILAFYWPVLSEHSAILWDTYDYSFPRALFIRDSFAQGIWPFWNPFMLAGSPIFAEPAVSAYHPFHLLIAVAPEGLDSFTLMQWLLVGLPVFGAIGLYRLTREIGFAVSTAAFGAAVYGATFFGPLLGQLPIAFGVALFPWLTNSVFNLVQRSRFDWIAMSKTTLLAALFFYGTYFGTILYSAFFFAGAAFFGVYLKRREKFSNFSHWKTVGLHLMAVTVLTMLLAMPHLLPSIENRSFFYSAISKDFVSPDPRVRGVTLPKDHVVEVIPNERTLIGVLLNSRDLARDGAFWVIGPGYAVFFLWLFSLKGIRRDRRVQVLWVALTIGISYLLGPRSLVFDVVFDYVPLLNNIRYPVFSFPFVAFILLLLAMYSLEKLLRESSPAIRSVVVFLLCAETFIFAWNTGVFDDRAPAIVKSVTTEELAGLSLRDRKRSVSVGERERPLREETELRFDQKEWITEKRLSPHGYATSDSPFYWYLKSSKFLERFAYCATGILPQPDAENLTSKLMSDAANEVAGLPEGQFFGTIDALLISTPCTIQGLTIEPNRIEIEVAAVAPSALIITDKNYPGWRAKIDGATTETFTANYLFKGLMVPAGARKVELRFEPESFMTGLRVAMMALIVLIGGVAFQALRRRTMPSQF